MLTAERPREISANSTEAQSGVIKPAISPEEFREATGGAIGLHSIYRGLENGDIRSLRIGRKYLIPRSEVTAFFEREASK
jgi:excisionase family DNA binding protein